MPSGLEAQLDRELERAIRDDPAFAQWLLSHTKFADRSATYLWSRSDSPWGTIDYRYVDIETGLEKSVRKQCETDVLAVFRTGDDQIVALHIENKIGSGKFTELQPEMYSQRAEQWKDNVRYKSYTDFETILLAPESFHQRNLDRCGLFDRFVSHEAIAEHLPAFASRAPGAQEVRSQAP